MRYHFVPDFDRFLSQAQDQADNTKFLTDELGQGLGESEHQRSRFLAWSATFDYVRNQLQYCELRIFDIPYLHSCVRTIGEVALYEASMEAEGVLKAWANNQKCMAFGL